MDFSFKWFLKRANVKVAVEYGNMSIISLISIHAIYEKQFRRDLVCGPNLYNFGTFLQVHDYKFMGSMHRCETAGLV